MSFYGPAAGVDLARTAEVFRVVNVDADPDAGNLSDEDLRVLRAGGKNRVLSYMNVGACEEYRSYFATAPAGFASCKSSGAATTRYSDEYPDEVWMDLSNAAYRRLVVEHVAARLAARVDGFYLDNLEVLEHGAGARLGPCGPACVQGGLDLVWELRQRYPDKLIVMQNATSDATRRGVTHGAPFPSLLDGVAHEEVYGATADPASRPEMLAWRDMRLAPGGRPFWLAAEEYVGGCSAALVGEAGRLRARARADGIEAYVTDGSGAQAAPCFALR